MRALVVVAFNEVIELGLLLQEVFAGRLGGLQLQGQMHTLVPSVLLRMARLDALDRDAEPEPPDREFGEVEEGIRTSKGNAVIGANGLGQAELLEDGLEHRKGVGFLGGGERLAREEIATGGVGDRKRIAVAPVGEHELALVVGAPQVIGLTGNRQRRSRRSITPRSSALDQVMAIEHRMHCADRRRVHIRVEAVELLPDLRRAPARLVLFQAHDPSFDLEGQLVGLAV